MQHYAKLECVLWLDGVRTIPIDVPIPDVIFDNATAVIQQQHELSEIKMRYRIQALEHELEVASRCRNKQKKWRLFK